MMSRKIYCIRKTHLLRPDEFICSCCGFIGEHPFSECPKCKSEITKVKHTASWVDEIELEDIIFHD